VDDEKEIDFNLVLEGSDLSLKEKEYNL